jgi:hypothetical protein
MEIFTIKMKDIIMVSCTDKLDVDSCLDMIRSAAQAAKHPGDFNIRFDFSDTDIEQYPQGEVYSIVQRVHAEFTSPSHRYAFRNKIAMLLPAPLADRHIARIVRNELTRSGLHFEIFDAPERAYNWLEIRIENSDA